MWVGWLGKDVIQVDLYHHVEDKYRGCACTTIFNSNFSLNAIKHAFTNPKQGNDIDVSVIK
ncbi:hypothetical protein ACVXZ0_12800 [Staphylococcus aureus]